MLDGTPLGDDVPLGTFSDDAAVDVTGTAAGTITLTGAASGSAGISGAASGTIKLSGAASGTFGAFDTVSGDGDNVLGDDVPLGTFSETDDTVISGTAVGTITLAGAASGAVGVSGSAAGTISLAGAALGEYVKPVDEIVSELPPSIGVGTLMVRVPRKRQPAPHEITGTAAGVITLRGDARGLHEEAPPRTAEPIVRSGPPLSLVSPRLHVVAGTGAGVITMIGEARGTHERKDWTRYDNELLLMVA
jgi:hypothetical protein